MNLTQAQQMSKELEKLSTKAVEIKPKYTCRGAYPGCDTASVANNWVVEIKAVDMRTLHDHSIYTEDFTVESKKLKSLVKSAKEGLQTANTRIRVGKQLGY